MRHGYAFLTAALLLLCSCTTQTTAAETHIPAQTAAASAEGYGEDDLLAMQAFLLGRQAGCGGRNYDLNHDGEWDVFDMALLRRAVMEKHEEPAARDAFCITANGTMFMAEFAENASATAFRALLEKGALTIRMSDYGSFEKVGSLGTTLPRSDEKITTEPGDVILYQGTSITVYYDRNTWSFTRLGKIRDVTKDQLLATFGDGDVEITFSLPEDAHSIL